MKIRMLAILGVLAIAAPAFISAPAADAGLWSKIKKGAKKTWNKVKKGVKKGARKVKKAAKKVVSGVKAASKRFLRGLKRLGKRGAKAALRRAFYGYISANRASFLRRAKPLRKSEKAYLYRYFPRKLVDGTRVLERSGATGYFIKSASATTFGPELVVIRKGRRSNNLLKHEMVHECQYAKYGVKGFSYRYADQYVNGGFSYNNIKFEKQAYHFQKKGKGRVSRYLGYCR